MADHPPELLSDHDILRILNEDFNMAEIETFSDLALQVMEGTSYSVGGQPSSTSSTETRRKGKKSRKHDEDVQSTSSKRTARSSDETESVPRALPCQLRSAYPQMFFNSINSSDLINVQSFFRTFMSGPCTFYIHHPVDPEFGVPSVVQAFSPNLFSHYLLGCFVTFPDMVLNLRQVRVHTNCLGYTKIVMETSVNASKIYDIPDYNWVPDTTHLRELYTSAPSPAGATLLQDCGDDRTVNTTTNLTNSSDDSTSVSGSFSKGFVKKKSKTPTGPELKLEGSPERLEAVQLAPDIPVSYLNSILCRAILLPRAISLHTKGNITLYIDENNFMKHVDVDLRPVIG